MESFIQTAYFIATMFIFGALEVAIIFRLLIKTLEPGTVQTETLIIMMIPLCKIIDQVFSIIFYPIIIISQWIHNILPSTLKSFFPSLDAASILDFVTSIPTYIPVIGSLFFIQDIANIDYSLIFPGAVDWTLLIALLIVFKLHHLAESIASNQIKHLKTLRAEKKRQSELEIIKAHYENPSNKHTTKTEDKTKTVVPLDVMRDLKEEITNLSKKAESASVDKLTGLLNRAEFDLLLEKAFSHSRIEKRAISLVFMDIDNFKHLNDTHGHQAGDLVLKTIGSLMLEVYEQNFCFRFGGEELAVILTDTQPNKAILKTETFQRKLSQVTFTELPKTPLTVSVGVLSIDYTATQRKYTSETILKTVDQAMYQSKAAGKNKITPIILT